MAAVLKKLSEPVQKFILHKQADFKMEKKRNVSIEQTIEYLLKDAYLPSINAQTSQGTSVRRNKS